jgi:filamentous hemagglutinin family protein
MSIDRATFGLRLILNGFEQTLLCGVLLFTSTATHAQIAPDATLGEERSQIVPRALGGESINGGAIRGTHLFHSFSEFNVGNGQQVYFANPTGIQTIFTRVTGNTSSNINGTLGVDGAANLFLLNPNGLLFGPNARLDVRGSFVGSTANAIQFGNQGAFSATNPTSPNPLLTIRPSALLFTQLNTAPIVSGSIAPVGTNAVDRSLFGLRVADGQNLLLVGGDVVVDGGNTGAGLVAQGGRIELGGLASTGAISIDEFKLTYPDGVARSNVSLVNDARVSVQGNNGNIAVNANTLIGTNGGRLVAGFNGTGTIAVNANIINFAGTSALDGVASGLGNIVANGANNGGDILINANSLTLSAGAEINTGVLATEQGSAGNIAIDADSISITDNASIAANTQGQGNAGNISINADSISIAGALISTGTRGQGNAGNIAIQVDQVNLKNGASIDSSVDPQGVGRGGDVSIQSNSLSMEGAGIISRVELDGQGNSGNISIKTGALSATQGSQLSTSVFGQGNGGNISIEAQDILFRDLPIVGGAPTPSGIFNIVDFTGIGNAGDVRIKTGTLTILNDAGIITYTRGLGNAGNIFIQAEQLNLLAAGSGIDSSAVLGTGNAGNIQIQTNSLSMAGSSAISSSTNTTGNGGNIQIDTDSLVMERPSVRGSKAVPEPPDAMFSGVISTGTTSSGLAGNITLNIRDTLFMDQGRVSSAVLDGGTLVPQLRGSGLAGNIQVNTGSLQAIRSFFETSSSGQGNAGEVVIRAQDSISLNNGSIISSTISSFRGSNAIGNSGNIEIEARSLLMDNAQLLSFTDALGDAGKVQIRVQDQIILDGRNGFTSIVTSVSNNGIGRGGDILIEAQSLLMDNAQLLSLTDALGDAGKVQIRVQDQIILDGRNGFTSIATSVSNNGIGRGGDILIEAGSVQLNSAELTTSTFGKGNAGNVVISVRDRVELSQGGQFLAGTTGQGDAGNVILRANNLIVDGVDPRTSKLSGIFTLVGQSAVGRARDIDIDVNSLTIKNGGRIGASTFGQGNAGDINIRVRDRMVLSGATPIDQAISSISSAATETATGTAGTIRISNPQILEIRDGARMIVNSVNNQKGGNIEIQARQLLLNQGSISAETASTDGGNITLQLNALSLRNQSRISTTAGVAQLGGNGGNITINAGAIVAPTKENSDITADAFNGRGGNVRINADTIFGIQPRAQATSESDITASSQLGVQGDISVNQAEVQPTQGAIELPTKLIDASNQIAQACPRNLADWGQFVTSGRGSMPPSPMDPLSGIGILNSLAEAEDQPNAVSAEAIKSETASKPISNGSSAIAPPEMIEAQGWTKHPNGKVSLVSQSSKVMPSSRPTVNCSI